MKWKKSMETPNNTESSVESNETAESLEDLKQDILSWYSKDDIENYPWREKGLIKDINFLEKSLGKNFVDSFVKWKKIENKNTTFETQKINLENLQEIAEEVKKLESQKSVETVESIILTTDELKEMEKIIYSQPIRRELNFFLEEQFKENISSKEVFWKKNIDEFSEKFKTKEEVDKFLKGMDNMFFDSLNEKYPYLSQDVTRNMWTGFTLALFEIYKDFSEDSKEKFFQIINNFKFQKLEKFLSQKNKNFLGRIDGFFEILENEEVKNKLQNWENNKILTNPYHFKNLFIEYINSENNQKETKEKLIENQEEGFKFEGLTEKESEDVKDMLWKSIEKINSEGVEGVESILWKFQNFENFKGEMKEKIKQNWWVVLQMLAVAPFLKDIFNTFLDWFGLNVEQLQEKHSGESLDSGKRKAINELFDNYQGKVEKLDGWERKEEDIFEDIDTNAQQKEILKNFDAESFRDIIKDYDFSDLEDKRVWKYSLPMDFLIKEGFVEEWKDSNFNQEEALNKEALNKFIKKYTEKFLSDENISENIDSGKDLAYLLLNKYVDFSEEVEESEIKSYKNWENFMKNTSFEQIINGRGSAFSKYKSEIQSTCNELKIPPKVLLALFIKEGSEGDVKSSPDSSSAMGLGQIVEGTREHITNNLAKNHLDSSEIPDEWQRTNAEHQIKASAVYLKYWYEETWDWLDAIVNYHTWGGPSNEEEAEAWLEKNPAIARNIPNTANLTSVERYNKWAKRYYWTIAIA